MSAPILQELYPGLSADEYEEIEALYAAFARLFLSAWEEIQSDSVKLREFQALLTEDIKSRVCCRSKIIGFKHHSPCQSILPTSGSRLRNKESEVSHFRSRDEL